MARNTSTNKEKASAQKASGNLSKSGTRKSAAARSRAVEVEPRILDDRTRRDIVGVGFIILGIVLFIAAAAPAGAIVTDFLSESLHVVFGVGCYIMPFFLVAIGGAVLYRMQSERMSLRVTLGLSLILVALLGIIALFTPTTGTGPAALFDRIALVTHGGYVGAALAWVARPSPPSCSSGWPSSASSSSDSPSPRFWRRCAPATTWTAIVPPPSFPMPSDL